MSREEVLKKKTEQYIFIHKDFCKKIGSNLFFMFSLSIMTKHRF